MLVRVEGRQPSAVEKRRRDGNVGQGGITRIALLSAGSVAATAVALVVYTAPVRAQVTTSNPLDDMKAAVERVLADADVPFTERQTRELTLVMEEQRQASERLFGDIMDFSRGPVRGADRDRAQAGIQWMNEAFEAKLAEMLTPEQRRVWMAFRAGELRRQGGLPALRLILADLAAPLEAGQDRPVTLIYVRAAERLRRAEETAADAGGAAAIVDEALEQVADYLTPVQVGAVLLASDPSSPWVRGADGPGDSSNGGHGEEQAGPVAQPPARTLTADLPREVVLAALRAVAWPTSTFVGGSARGSTAARSSDEIAQIRINNNAYTTENFGGLGPGFGGGRDGRGDRGGGIEVIQRGGVGDYHGNFSFDFRDESLTARNAFADNKPPFQQRNINANLSGPFIRDLLTASFTFNQNEQENADTVVAATPSGDVSFGIVRPAVRRTYSANGQVQMSDRHSLHFFSRYQDRTSRNNGIGDFTLPERGWTSTSSDVNVGLREIWSISPRTLHEVAFSHFGGDFASEPLTRAVAINVLDAFQSGGASQSNWRRNNTWNLSNLFWYEGERLTFKTGMELSYRTAASFSEDGFLGQFTFSSLDDFFAGRPLTYRVTRGEPLLDVAQTELGSFVQTDWRVSRRFTFFAGLRYEWQTNIDDFDNLDPRAGFAYSLGPSTVLRGGAGLFHQNFPIFLVQDVLRLDGTRQFEVVVSNPAFPDPFAGGTTTIVPPSSRRVFAPDLAVPHEVKASLSIERTLPWNVAVDASYDVGRGVNRFRTRNVNAPFPGGTVRPDPSQGNILQLESTARSRSHSLRVGFRQRLRVLTYNGSYTLSSNYDDGEGPFSQPMNSYDPGADWGRSGFNRTHRYNFTVNSQAPFGTLFTVSGFGHSGNPYTITTGKDDNNDQNTNDRPPGVPRNSADGPRFFNVDMTLSKTFRLRNTGGSGRGGGTLLSVYANLNNAFNMVNLRNPSGVLTSSFFGIPTSASSARDVEVGMRYQF